ncbi:putative peptidoglycan binding domain protein [[Clostridium] bifermentans ATCC 638]|uniref:Putative peptidoglycan binding domain protein n=1 Tax=Paraclostridium bifermentans ATCC 638 = DSM 14991 TaxID=1233171 RepID=T4VVF5_PARBF|nr:spore cortex-lytic germination protein SleC [Paraclostridium bifermentans]EQK44697.1 putative peptidoglycan binding domain protein [[Clostridium] bifermentans ATCC 638] [Paraclostridium bifermentans ATCC 638 = DSM 14991]RIZ57832.1 peptidoglycan-binding protein [Paraclostridium bifermentans]UAG17903.1 peptidoglycan-binding protein [Paraclostridium bifermentans]
MQDGFLTVSVVDSTTNFPVVGANVNVYSVGDDNKASTVIYQNLKTDISGQVVGLNLAAPDLIYSQQPSDVRPYSQYIVEVIKDGYETIIINGTQVLATVIAQQGIQMIPRQRSKRLYSRQNEIVVDIGAHTLWGTYPPKIPESDLKPIPPPTGFVVLDNPVVPEFVVVHDGLPENKNAPDYWVYFKDYVKNVASSEIYSTWPTETILANVIAIVSFTLNRVFTEWYRSKGYSFTITSTTAYDHKYIHERNVFDTISIAVDEVFNTFIKRPPTARQPLLAQYCDGNKTQCPGQMTQWGSKNLGDQGLSYEEILRKFYGESIVLEKAPVVSGVPVSFPGEALKVGSSGKDVRTIQNQLNAISKGYPAIPKVKEDGVFGQDTADSVKVFQGIFGLPQSGIVDFKTWYELSRVYVAVTKIASLNPTI